MRKIPWEEIRNKYIYGIEKDGRLEFPSIRDLSKEYNIDVGIIGHKASKEGWVESRKQYLNDRSTKTQQKVVDEVSNDIAKFDIDLFKQAEAVKEKVNELIKNIKRPTDAFTIANTLKALKSVEQDVIGEGNGKSSDTIQINVPSEDGKVGTVKVLSGERT